MEACTFDIGVDVYACLQHRVAAIAFVSKYEGIEACPHATLPAAGSCYTCRMNMQEVSMLLHAFICTHVCMYACSQKHTSACTRIVVIAYRSSSTAR